MTEEGYKAKLQEPKIINQIRKKIAYFALAQVLAVESLFVAGLAEQFWGDYAAGLDSRLKREKVKKVFPKIGEE